MVGNLEDRFSYDTALSYAVSHRYRGIKIGIAMRKHVFANMNYRGMGQPGHRQSLISTFDELRCEKTCLRSF